MSFLIIVFGGNICEIFLNGLDDLELSRGGEALGDTLEEKLLHEVGEDTSCDLHSLDGVWY